MKYGLVKKEEELSFQSHLEGILELPLMVSVCLRITCKTNNAIFYTGEKIMMKTSLRVSPFSECLAGMKKGEICKMLLYNPDYLNEWL